MLATILKPLIEAGISRIVAPSVRDLRRTSDFGRSVSRAREVSLMPIRRSYAEKNADGASKRGPTTGFFAAVALLCLWQSPVRAQSPYCDDLRAQIARAGHDSGVERFQAAAAKQQAEISRTAAYARSLGCERQQFLFFGDPPPPQCGGLNAKISQMQANLASLQQRAGGGARDALIARYDAQCRQRPTTTATAQRPRNFFEELFGIPPAPESGGLREAPLEPFGEDGDRARGGPVAICVRSCDGGFFPISYSAHRANLEELDSLCKALCPNAEASLYTRSMRGDVESSVSIDGAAYADHPNALKFQKTYDPSCSCKPPGKSWVEALAEAEQILAASHGSDEVVSVERAEQLSRPLVPGESRKSGRKSERAAPPPPPPLPEVADAPSAEAKQEADKAPSVFKEIVGPDGVRRRVRVVAPTL
jgi:hypothetical protein